MKKPFYKKWWFIAIVVLVLLSALFGGGGDKKEEPVAKEDPEVVEEVVKNEPEEEPQEETKEPEEEPEPVELTRKEEIEKLIWDRAEAEYAKSFEINKITINDNLGEGGEGTYIVLVYADFTAKNKTKTADDMVKMHSTDIAGFLHQEGVTDVAEVAVFTKDLYNNRSLKSSFEWKDNGFYLSDEMGYEQ